MTYGHKLSEIAKIIPEFTDDIIPLQFTGLTDKNGKEIYEGDNLQDRFGAVSEVVYVEEFAGFKELSKIGYSYISQEIINNDNIKVIGNIYDV